MSDPIEAHTPPVDIPPRGEYLHQRAFRMGDSDWDKLKVIAARHQRTPSDVIRYLVKDFLEGQK